MQKIESFVHLLADGARLRLFPNASNRIHKKPIVATYSGGYFYADGSDPCDGPDYYVGDVLIYNDRIERVE